VSSVAFHLREVSKWLLKAPLKLNWTSQYKVKTLPENSLPDGLIGAMQGSPKSQGSDLKFWFYQIKWLVRTPKVEMKSYGAWVPAQMLASTAESREPADPKLQ
jgi:hypothetical protein